MKMLLFCYTCMSAEIKGLKTIYHNKDGAFITHRCRNLHHAMERFRLHEESDWHKDYIKQLCYVDKSCDETLISKKARNKQIFLTIL